MKNFLQKNRQLIIGAIFGATLIFVFSSLIVEKRLASLESNIETNLNESAKSLINLAGEIARGEANAVAGMVAIDCTVVEQAQFDNRLGRLDAGLSLTELNELDTLFSRCAPVSVIKRSAMVVQLEQEFKILSLLVEQRKIVGKYDEYDLKLGSWEELVLKEKQITKLSFDSVNLQYEIIKQLMSGLKVDSEAANELKNQGQLIRVELTKLVNEVAVLREGLK